MQDSLTPDPVAGLEQGSCLHSVNNSRAVTSVSALDIHQAVKLASDAAQHHTAHDQE